MKNFDNNIGFGEKRHFFRRKLSKIAENCDHNIDPWHLRERKTNLRINKQVSTVDIFISNFPLSPILY
jgi:hypothetical protein